MYTHTVLLTIFAGLAAAGSVQVRQLLGTGTSSSEFSQGGCKDVLFAWARGSTEIGNMVRYPRRYSFSPY
jgi:cutinase